jgi:hypothetical protein
VAGKVPNTSTLSIGELGINLTDQKLFSSDGSSVFELGANLTSQFVYSSLIVGNSSVNTVVNSSSINVKSIIANGSVGTANQVLTSNGTGIYWAAAIGGSSVGGSNTQIQFNDSGIANATAGFTFDKTSNTVSVGNTTVNTVANGSSILPGILALNNQTVNDNFTIPVGTSTVMAGPVTIATGKTLTVSSGSRLVVI